MYKQCLILYFVSFIFCQEKIGSKSIIPNSISIYDKNGNLIQFPFSGGYFALYAQLLDYDNNQKLDLFFLSTSIGKIYRYEQESPGSLKFFEQNYVTNIKQSLSWFQISDADNDNDFDLYVLDDFDSFSYLENMGSNNAPIFKDFNRIRDSHNEIIIAESGTIPVMYDIDNDGDKDLFITTQTEGHIRFYKNASAHIPIFDSITSNYANVEVLSRAKKKHGKSTFAFIDLDRDNDIDILWGDIFQNYFYYLENLGNNVNPNYQIINDHFDFSNSIKSNSSYNLPLFADLNLDGYQDLIMLPQGDQLNTFQLYLGLTKHDSLEFSTNLLINTIDVGSFSYVDMADLNSDEKKDIIVSNYKGISNSYELFFYLQDPTNSNRFNESTLLSNLQLPWLNSNLRAFDFQIIDLNKDALWDIVFVDENGNLYQSLNTGSLISPTFSSFELLKSSMGNYCNFEIIDIDSDNDYDLISSQIVGKFYLFKSENDSLFNRTITRNLLSSFFTNGVTFSSIDKNSFLVINQRDNSNYILKLNLDFTLNTINPVNLSFPFLAANANLDLNDINNDGSLDYLFGSRNGGILLYLGEFDQKPITNLSNLYPNPRRDNLQYLIIPDNSILQKIELYDILGRLITISYSKTLNKISLAFPEMAKGIYFIVLYLSDKKLVFKSVFL